MPDADRSAPRRLDSDDVALVLDIQQLPGEEMPWDQDAVLDPDEIKKHRERTLTEIDRGEPAPDRAGTAGQVARLDGLATEELRDGETDDPVVATEEGLTYVPPSDPPFHPDLSDPDRIEVATGSAVSALSEPYDENHRSGLLTEEDDLTDRVREALRADAATTEYADRIAIATKGSTAVVRGIVDDIDDSDTIAAVIERVDGIHTVIDQTELPG